MSTYTENAAICAKFYDLSLDSMSVACFIRRVHSYFDQSGAVLFVGGMFAVIQQGDNFDETSFYTVARTGKTSRGEVSRH